MLDQPDAWQSRGEKKSSKTVLQLSTEQPTATALAMRDRLEKAPWSPERKLQLLLLPALNPLRSSESDRRIKVVEDHFKHEPEYTVVSAIHSTARGTATELSDLDVIIINENGDQTEILKELARDCIRNGIHTDGPLDDDPMMASSVIRSRRILESEEDVYFDRKIADLFAYPVRGDHQYLIEQLLEKLQVDTFFDRSDAVKRIMKLVVENIYPEGRNHERLWLEPILEELQQRGSSTPLWQSVEEIMVARENLISNPPNINELAYLYDIDIQFPDILFMNKFKIPRLQNISDETAELEKSFGLEADEKIRSYAHDVWKNLKKTYQFLDEVDQSDPYFIKATDILTSWGSGILRWSMRIRDGGVKKFMEELFREVSEDKDDNSKTLRGEKGFSSFTKGLSSLPKGFFGVEEQENLKKIYLLDYEIRKKWGYFD